MRQVSSRMLVLLLVLLTVVLVHSFGVGAPPAHAGGVTWLDNDPNEPPTPDDVEGDSDEGDSDEDDSDEDDGPVPESIGMPPRIRLDG